MPYPVAGSRGHLGKGVFGAKGHSGKSVDRGRLQQISAQGETFFLSLPHSEVPRGLGPFGDGCVLGLSRPLGALGGRGCQRLADLRSRSSEVPKAASRAISPG